MGGVELGAKKSNNVGEPELEKMHTTKGRVATFIGVFVVMQAVSVLLWVLIARAFSLH